MNAGRPTGDRSWAWAFLALSAAAFACYALGVAGISRWGGRAALAAWLAAGIQLAPLAAPLLLSTDAWTYWDYGRIAAVHGGNPYVEVPADFARDPAFPWVGAGWRETPSVYGPAFTLASEPLALAASESADAAAWLYKTLAAAAVLAAAALAARVSRRKVLAWAFVGWNPLLALHFGGGGHNDAWMAGLVVGALALAASGRRQLAGSAWAVAALIKWVPLALLPLRALEARATGRRVGHLGFATAAAVLVGLASWRYGWHWLESFGPLARNANAETSFSLPHRLESAGLPHPGGIAVLGLAFGIAYLWLLREAARGRSRLGLATGLALLATPWLVPWYAVWAVPLAAAEDDTSAKLLALAVSAYLLPQTVPL